MSAELTDRALLDLLVKCALIPSAAIEDAAGYDHGATLFRAKKFCELLRALSAPSEAAAVPSGWKLVPVEPTTEMKLAADQYASDTKDRAKGIWWWGRVYQTMLAAAPAGGGIKP